MDKNEAESCESLWNLVVSKPTGARKMRATSVSLLGSDVSNNRATSKENNNVSQPHKLQCQGAATTKQCTLAPRPTGVGGAAKSHSTTEGAILSVLAASSLPGEGFLTGRDGASFQCALGALAGISGPPTPRRSLCHALLRHLTHDKSANETARIGCDWC